MDCGVSIQRRLRGCIRQHDLGRAAALVPCCPSGDWGTGEQLLPPQGEALVIPKVESLVGAHCLHLRNQYLLGLSVVRANSHQ